MADDKVLMDEAEMPPLMVRVRAPATLPGGYTFEALLNDDPDRPFTCEVVSFGISTDRNLNAWYPSNASILFLFKAEEDLS